MSHQEVLDRAKASQAVLSSQTKEELKKFVAAKEAEKAEQADEQIDESLTYDPAFLDTPNRPPLNLANIARRKKIEQNLEDLRIDDLFVSNEVRQKVVIIPNRLEVVYRTPTAGEDLYIKKRMGEVRNEVFRFVEDRLVLMALCLHIASVNGVKFADLTDLKGEIDEEAFNARYSQISKLPQVIINDMWVNLTWFQDRVSKALEPESLKDG